jgi:threonine aldolase
VDTNIVIFSIEPRLGAAAEFAAQLKARGVWGLAVGPAQIRLVTHLDVSADDCRRAAKIIRETAGQVVNGSKAAVELEPAY